MLQLLRDKFSLIICFYEAGKHTKEKGHSNTFCRQNKKNKTIIVVRKIYKKHIENTTNWYTDLDIGWANKFAADNVNKVIAMSL